MKHMTGNRKDAMERKTENDKTKTEKHKRTNRKGQT